MPRQDSRSCQQDRPRLALYVVRERLGDIADDPIEFRSLRCSPVLGIGAEYELPVGTSVIREFAEPLQQPAVDVDLCEGMLSEQAGLGLSRISLRHSQRKEAPLPQAAC
jgi:hypothetical protein